MRKAAVLIEALPYIQEFRDKQVVIKFGGSALADQKVMEDVLEDVVFLATVGIQPVLVHGGGKHISQAMERAGLEAEFVAGHRVTDRKTLGIVREVLAGEVNGRIVEQIARHGARAVPGFQEEKSLLRATRKTIEVHQEDGTLKRRDIGYVGEVRAVDIERLRRLEEEGDILVVPPIGQDESGQLYNVNADSAAAAIACHLQAEKIVFLSNVHGIMGRPGDPDSFLSSVDRNQVDELISEGIIDGGMLPKVSACLESVASGVHKAHIIDATLDHSLLLEIFTDEGVGTQIVSS